MEIEDLKEFKKQLKKFKKVAKKDMIEGVKMADELLKVIPEIYNTPEFKTDKNHIKKMRHLTETLILYKTQCEQIMELKRKWEA